MLIGRLGYRLIMWYNLPITQSDTGRFSFQNADGFSNNLLLAKRPLQSDFRPADCVMTSADCKGRFVMEYVTKSGATFVSLKPKRNRPCIYVIYNTINRKVYVGSAVSFYSRRAIHNKRLQNNQHHSRHLQSAWNKYGRESFEFFVVEYCDKSETLITEQGWIDSCRAAESGFGYNINPNAASWLGAKHSEETRQKLSRLATGRKMPKKLLEKLVRLNSGPHPEWRRKKKLGDGNPNAKLKKVDVQKIKQLLEGGGNVARIAEMFSVTYNAIWEINRGIKWSDVRAPEKLLYTKSELARCKKSGRKSQSGEHNPNAKLTDDLVKRIRRDYSTGRYTYVSLGKKYGVSDSTVWRAVNNKWGKK